MPSSAENLPQRDFWAQARPVKRTGLFSSYYYTINRLFAKQSLRRVGEISVTLPNGLYFVRLNEKKRHAE
ncbi:MAG TPA: hypothetical protein VFW40_12230, partial [Capsulimonadaceae bacterium]|nr:hypothetical protein [Capsulimonadaceae bacterium]